MRTGAEHVTVGQEAPVDRRPHLAHGALGDQAGGIEPLVEMPGQCMVLPAGRAAEMIERQIEASIDVRLDRVLRIAVAPHVFAGLDRAELRRRAVLVGAANEQYFVAELAAETPMHIRGQERADEIAEVLDAVDVRQGAGDQNLAHDMSFRRSDAGPKNESPSASAEGLGFSASASRDGTRVNPSGRTSCGRAGAFASHARPASGSWCAHNDPSQSQMQQSYLPFNPAPGP